jgi:hypothetical protein
MRKKWPRRTPYYLNGEVDKVSHPILSELGILSKPDLLVHKPGYMDGNHAVIEVKHSRGERDGLKKDLETLSLFVNKAGYRRGILLIYGDEVTEEIVNPIGRIAVRVKELASIELWLHQAVGRAANHIMTLSPRA